MTNEEPIAEDIEIPTRPKLYKWLVPVFILVFVIAADQILKYWVKNNMILYTEKKVFGDWFILHFTENEGMAFGMKFFGVKGKYALSILRIGVALFGFWFLYHQIKKNAGILLLVCIALILGGALGNIIDCVFYGVIYSDMNMYDGGYLLGWVVDMLYFPVVHTHYPSWSPIKPGQEFIFFSPVFNIADAAISIGVISIILFNKKIFPPQLREEKQISEQELEDTENPENTNENEEIDTKGPEETI